MATKNRYKSKQTPIKNFIVPVQLQRIRQSVVTWRDAIDEAERAYWPYRVKMQQLFIDTELNGHVTACLQKRKNLTLLRKFGFMNNGTENEEVTAMFNQQWFFDFLSHTVDALFFGYNLISLGDIISDKVSGVDVVKRWNVSPDRKEVASFIYGVKGKNFLEDPFKDWYCYVPTPSSNGTSDCGYGLLYKVAIYEIFCRNLLAFNGDFVELFSQPYRLGKTNKTEEDERQEFANAIQQMGSSGWAIIDEGDKIEFLETALGGTGWQGYENLEKRCEAKISKVLLGHADAIDSVPGKLGNNNKKSPSEIAMEEIQTSDGRFVENVINGTLLPALRNIGLKIPDGIIQFKNDAEKEEIRVAEDASNKETAMIAQTMAQAGLIMDAKYFTERTGIPCSKAPVVKPTPTPTNKKIEAKLSEIYR